MKKLWIDTETTGLEAGVHAVYQIAGVIEIDGEVVESFNLKLRPAKGQYLNPKAMEVSGITKDGLERLPEAKKGYLQLLALFDKYVDRYDKQDKFIWVGQNPRFDYAFIDDLFNRHNNSYLYAYVHYHLIDIASIAMAMKDAGLIKLDKLKLESIAQAFGVSFSPHDATEDVRAMREIYAKMLELLCGSHKDNHNQNTLSNLASDMNAPKS